MEASFDSIQDGLPSRGEEVPPTEPWLMRTGSSQARMSLRTPHGQLGVSEGREHGADRKAWVARLPTPVDGVSVVVRITRATIT